MPRKPKGWSRRYEIVQRLCEHPSGTPRWRWKIIHYRGKYGASILDFRSGGDFVSDTLDFTDEQIIRRAGIGDVTVPVYVIREESK